MNHSIKTRPSLLHAALLATCLGSAAMAQAADVRITVPSGGGFVVRSANGTQEGLRVQDGGGVFLPTLSAQTPVATVLCFETTTGALGPCAAGVAAGPTGATGPAGTAGVAGATGPTGAAGPAGATGATGAAGTAGATGAGYANGTAGGQITLTSSSAPFSPQSPVTLTGDASLSNTGVLTIADGAITNNKIANLTIANANIAVNAITTSKVANGTVTTSKMADQAISTLKLLDSAVTTVKLADDAVSVAKLQGGAAAATRTYLRSDGVWVQPGQLVQGGTLASGATVPSTPTGGVYYAAQGGSTLILPAANVAGQTLTIITLDPQNGTSVILQSSGADTLVNASFSGNGIGSTLQGAFKYFLLSDGNGRWFVN